MNKIEKLKVIWLAKIIKASLETKDYFLGKEDFLALVHKKLLVLGEDTYRECLSKKESPDHCFSPHAFGYALKYEAVTTEGVRFESGENAEQFMLMADGLLESVTEQIIHAISSKTYQNSKGKPRSKECICEGCGC